MCVMIAFPRIRSGDLHTISERDMKEPRRQRCKCDSFILPRFPWVSPAILISDVRSKVRPVLGKTRVVYYPAGRNKRPTTR